MRGNAGLLERAHVPGRIAPGEYARVHLRMQGLDAAVEHFRKTRVIRDFGHREPGVLQQPGGAAGRDQADAQAREPARKIDDAGLVGNAEERLFDDGHQAVNREQ